MKKNKTRKIPSSDLVGKSSIIVGHPPYETLAKALAASKPGATIYLRAGTYVENNIPYCNGGSGIMLDGDSGFKKFINCTVKD